MPRIFTVCQKVCPNIQDFYGMSKGVSEYLYFYSTSKGVSVYLGFLWYVKRFVRILRIFTVCHEVCPNT